VSPSRRPEATFDNSLIAQTVSDRLISETKMGYKRTKPNPSFRYITEGLKANHQKHKMKQFH
jgi:hypothetical protein